MNRMSSRRIGQSRGDSNVRPLLSIVGNRKREEGIKAPPADDDPPVSTDDEDDSNTNNNDRPLKLAARSESKGRSFRAPGTRGPPPDLLDSSGDERTSRANIKTTTFGSKKDSSSRSSSSSKPNSQNTKGRDTTIKASKRKRSDSEANDKAVAATGAHLSQTPPSSADYLHDRIGFVKSNKISSTYGSRKNPRGSQSTAPNLPRTCS
jgi:hypothetical protein